MDRRIRITENDSDKSKKTNTKNKNKSVLTKNDTNVKILNDELREKWLKWFKKKNGENSTSPMENELFKAILKAALKLDFVSLKNKSKTDVQFYQNGLSYCFKLAEIEPPKKRVKKDYSIKGSEYITKKDWGSLYRPGRG